MLRIWDWERFQFSIDYEHKQATKIMLIQLWFSIQLVMSLPSIAIAQDSVRKKAP
jgi:hypothetical protein